MFKGDYMKKTFCFILIAGLFSFAIMACGTNSSSPDSQPGAEIIQQYNFHVEGEPTIGSITLPQQFAVADGWGLLEIKCQQAGYSLVPYAGETVSFVKYSITEKWYHPAIPEPAGDPLYLRVLAKDQTSMCGYLSVREDSDAAPGVFAVNDPYIR